MGILILALLGRASSGWCPFGWKPPGSLYRKLWAITLGILLASTYGNPWLVFTCIPVYLSRIEQTKWLMSFQSVTGSVMLGVIGCLQALAVFAPIAWMLADLTLLPLAGFGMLRGVYYYCAQWLPKLGPGASLIDAKTAWAELAWYATLAVPAVIKINGGWNGALV